MSTIKKDFYALNFTENQIEKLIKITEIEVTQQLQQLNEKLPNLKDAEQMFLELKAEYDAINNKLNENKSLLDSLVRFRENTTSNKVIRILRTTSSLDNPVKQKREIKWVQLAASTLKELNRFLTPELLYQSIIHQHPEIASKVQNKGTNLKDRIIANFIRSSDPNIERKRGERLIMSYKDKIGLSSWFDNEGVPLAKYMKEFVHKK